MKYSKQTNEYYCGPATVKMILEMYGIAKSQKQLARELKTTIKSGTSHKEITKILSKYRIPFKEKRKNGKIKELRNIPANEIIFTCRYLPEERTGHYVIVKKIESKSINLIDPYFGKNKKLSLNYFKKTWHGTHVPYGWYIAIKSN